MQPTSPALGQTPGQGGDPNQSAPTQQEGTPIRFNEPLTDLGYAKMGVAPFPPDGNVEFYLKVTGPEELLQLFERTSRIISLKAVPESQVEPRVIAEAQRNNSEQREKATVEEGELDWSVTRFIEVEYVAAKPEEVYFLTFELDPDVRRGCRDIYWTVGKMTRTGGTPIHAPKKISGVDRGIVKAEVEDSLYAYTVKSLWKDNIPI